MTTSASAHPIRTLREHVTALEAAITLCLADPRPRSVHRLRTTTRRIEGQFAMLALLPQIPEHDKLARKAQRTLKQLRRAAGRVRDLDVQLDLIRSITPDKASPSLERDSAELISALEDQRDAAADKLLRKLRRRQADVANLLESLLETLEPVQRLALSPSQLTTLARDWFANNTPPEPDSNPDDPDHLHALRKNAKLARYIAENAPKSAKTPRRLAAAFESVQEAGGHWHDWLVLADIASNRLGGSSPLTKAFLHRCHLALTVYRRHLREAAA
ncbi:CHAD domain-containing protein [Edaphobacter aggregans]|uniref:CHAD domain-containing protein n=1 Tax=Edaphobacter aggregans TaxID=570835 RepID=UPI0005579533|nr:CHAD domain-containing protein [Edaphobacter aggregans]